MASTDPTSTLRRKLAKAKGRDPSGDRSALRALRMSLARASRDLMDLPLSVIGATQSRCGQDDLATYLNAEALLMLFEGPDRLSGAVTMDLPLTAALIQQQTMGKVLPNEPVGRPYTETDAALSAPLVEAMLTRAAEMAQLPQDRLCLDGYRFGARAEEAQSLALALNGDQFRVFDLTIDIANGLHQGVITLVLPEPDSPEECIAPDVVKTPAGPNLNASAMGAKADLLAVLCRLQIPLSEFSKMKPGDLIPLKPRRIEQTELQTIIGTTVVAGRLGQVDGYRAVRVNETAMPTSDDLLLEVDDDPTPNAFALRAARLRGQDENTADPIPDVAFEVDETPASSPPDPDAGAQDQTNGIDAMSPDEAAAEISELAGLSEGRAHDVLAPS